MVSFDDSGAGRIGRRTFVSALGTAAGALALSSSSAASVGGDDGADGELEALSFYSTASQIAPDGGPLTDEERVLAWASENAEIVIADDGTDEDDVVFYEDERIPLISRDGNVVGIGSAGFVSDERGGFDAGNEQFLLNVWDELIGGGTVLWDESHRQYWDLASHDSFRRYAEDHGYELEALE